MSARSPSGRDFGLKVMKKPVSPYDTAKTSKSTSRTKLRKPVKDRKIMHVPPLKLKSHRRLGSKLTTGSRMTTYRNMNPLSTSREFVISEECTIERDATVKEEQISVLSAGSPTKNEIVVRHAKNQSRYRQE